MRWAWDEARLCTRVAKGVAAPEQSQGLGSSNLVRVGHQCNVLWRGHVEEEEQSLEALIRLEAPASGT